jgi:FkbM family methyltransferase
MITEKEANVRRIVDVTPKDLKPFKVAEWDHPDEMSRDWNDLCNRVLYKQHWIDYIKKGDLTIDIGAHTGDSTVLLGVLSENVIAFEPNEKVYPILQFNAQLNPHMNIRTYKAAIMPTTGDCKLYDRSQRYCNMSTIEQEGPAFTVKGFNICDFLDMHSINYADVSFMKIDAEGLDIEIFKSFKGDLRPSLYIEWCEDLTEEQFLKPIREAGYRPIDPFTNDDLKTRHADIICIPE